MKSIIFIILFLLSSQILCAQTILLKYDNSSKSFSIKKCKNDLTDCEKFNKEIEIGKTYNVIISGINTIVTKSDIEIKPFLLESSTPTIIQPLFSGILNFVLSFIVTFSPTPILLSNRFNI